MATKFASRHGAAFVGSSAGTHAGLMERSAASTP